jgi:calcineurin-like phosphoesterase family protein
MTIWFTSDTHFLHYNIVEYSQRPFSSLDDMHEQIVQAWNSRVKPGDVVYHLGDFAISYGKKHQDAIDAILFRLYGNKFLIKGNHDRKEVTSNHHWTAVHDYHELKVDMGGIHKQRIIMCHYPLKSWNQMHRGSWMLHGHCHGNLTHDKGRIMDVGVDVHEYAPISLDMVAAYMSSREVQSIDHHEATSSS